MNLTTRYLGFELPHPFLPGASPLVDDLDTVRRLEDAGAAAIVMHSLFEEQIVHEQVAATAFLDAPADSFPEALSYLPEPDGYALGPEEYLEQIARIKEAVSVPVVASLNGTTHGAWLRYGRLIEQAGADALELNVYMLAADPSVSGVEIERRLLEVVAALKESLGIPLAVKLSPYHTSLAHFAAELELAGADGLVVLNRFYQADLDLDELEVQPTLRLSDPSELLLRLRWLAILSSQRSLSLAVTGGVHSPEDAVKAVMCGAHAVQVVSALLRHGPAHLSALVEGLARWLEEREYESLEQMRGSMNLSRCPDAAAYERANYLQVLQSYRAPA
ncbi:MAG: dihydroorotate dehydrogenase-like protein [Thermoanaerobaculia bacterium]|nr:dihydroorotate dehydrogenase-like protein [Thermoanaerobaculia bacterium]